MQPEFDKWFKEEMNTNPDSFRQPLDTHRKDLQNGWEACKQKVLKILRQPRQNADLSWDYCDSRHIEDVEKL